MEPWGTPALTFFQVENCLLRATRCFHLKSHVNLKSHALGELILGVLIFIDNKWD